MATIIFGIDGPVLRGWQQHEDFSVSLVQADEAIGGTTLTQSRVKDINYDVQATVGTAIKQNVVASTALENKQLTLSSLTPAICDVDQSGTIILTGAGGTCTVRVTGQTGYRDISQSISVIGGANLYSQRLGEETSSSLRKYLFDQQVAALEGLTPGATTQRGGMNSGTQMSGSYGGVNTNCFVRARTADRPNFHQLPLDVLDPLLDDTYGSAGWKVWISDRHFLSWRGHGSGASSGSGWESNGEIVVGYSATPWAGAVAKILPANWLSYLPTTIISLEPSPMAAWVRRFNVNSANERRWVVPVQIGTTRDEVGVVQTPFSPNVGATPFIGGDSGSPVFVGIHNELVMLGNVHTTAGLTSTSTYHELANRNFINDAMKRLATVAGNPAANSYAVGEVNLGANFTSYA